MKGKKKKKEREDEREEISIHSGEGLLEIAPGRLHSPRGRSDEEHSMKITAKNKVGSCCVSRRKRRIMIKKCNERGERKQGERGER